MTCALPSPLFPGGRVRSPEWLAAFERKVPFEADGLSFDSGFFCGNGQRFRRLGPRHYSFRTRVGEQPFSYRYHFRIDGPRDGADLRLRAVDFQMYDPPSVHRETAAVVSYDGYAWEGVPESRIQVLPDAWDADPGYSRFGGAYAVEYDLKLAHLPAWVASPMPYVPEDLERLLAFVRETGGTVRSIGRTACGASVPLVSVPASASRGRRPTRVFVTGGQHPSETAGILAVEGMLREVVRGGAAADVELHAIPILCVDGWLFGRTVVNCADEEGCNLNRDWADLSQPETRGVLRAVRDTGPDAFVDCHNGRGWGVHRLQDAYPETPETTDLLDGVAERMGAEGHHVIVREPRGVLPGLSSLEATGRGGAPVAFIYENRLTPARRREEYQEGGRSLIRALAAMPRPGG